MKSGSAATLAPRLHSATNKRTTRVNHSLLTALPLCLLALLLGLWKVAASSPSNAGPASQPAPITAGLPSLDLPLADVNAAPAGSGVTQAKNLKVGDTVWHNGQWMSVAGVKPIKPKETVTLTVQDEKTGEVSTITGEASKDTVEIAAAPKGRKTSVAAPASSPAPVVAAVDPAKSVLPTQAIQHIKAGQLVASRNPRTGKTEFKKVSRTFKRIAHDIVTLELADAKTGRIVDTLRGTP
jgi:hypothetical protein